LKRSIVIAGHKTSVSLEDEFWESPKEIAGERGVTLGELVLVRYLTFCAWLRGARETRPRQTFGWGHPIIRAGEKKSPGRLRGRGFEADRVRHLKSPASPSSPNLERRVSVPEALGKTC
jgi:hypothetical protein